ncbi:MAG TPA: methyltransferase domain-containing protein [Burkholderiaceae bacterium]|nr:methyltransferase domain-containing protein [Burkholderiaceae bacterium]
MQQFNERDPQSPAFWDERFGKQCTPWDRGGVPQALRDFVAAAPAPLVTLIPGCGSAYELAFLAGAGWDATAIDFSPAAVAAGKAAVGQYAARVVEADFFTWQPARPLQLIYERAFLCAMPRARWPDVAARWAALLPPGGLLAGFFFFDDAPKGPPFGIARAQLDALLAPCFDCEADLAVADSIPVFQGKERWLQWRRR